jgi:uncharacterized cupin superfamily protein
MTARFHRLRPGGDPKTGMQPSTLMSPGSFLTADRSETIHEAYRSPEGNVTAGVWECAPTREDIKRYGVDEFCTVIEGSLTVTDREGNSETFGPGDSFVMTRNFSGIWHNETTLKKFWMIVEPKEAG